MVVESSDLVDDVCEVVDNFVGPLCMLSYPAYIPTCILIMVMWSVNW